jgi:uncharacterized protein YaaR (DUF327 family)
MKIKKTGRKYSGTEEVTPGSGRRLKDTRRASFTESIASAERSIQSKALQDMVDDILAQGRKLARKADLRELKEYRRLISLFLDAVVERSHRFTKQGFLDRVGRHKVYAIIRKIDSEMELLAAEVMKTEKDNLKILERLDIIKGLILDKEL